MSRNKSLNNQIDKWILDNPKKPNETGYYAKISQLFGIHPEKARKRWRMLQRQGAVSTNFVHTIGTPIPDSSISTYSPDSGVKIISVDGNKPAQQDIQFDTDEDISTLEDVIRVSNIDINVFDVSGYQIKSYTGWTKDEKGESIPKKMFSVRVTLKAKKIDTSLSMQKELILNEMKKHSRVGIFPGIYDIKKVVEGDCALEINIPDLHIGKLAWGKETGEDYDIKIAIDRYKTAVVELLSRVNLSTIGKIILPVGNDMINVDSKSNTTTAGTPQSCDSRFGKMFQTAKELLIDTIDSLREIAPVEVIVVPGNHDTVAMFTLGEVLDAWYHRDARVTVSNTHTPRKYVQFGNNLIMYTHGHNEKLNDLGIICATEQPQLWAATKFRRVHVGHFHHSKQIKFTDVQEHPGFTVKILNSLSSNDAWHAEKGYLSLKGAEAFLYHKEKGLLANYYYMNQ